MGYVLAFDHRHPRPPREMQDLLGGKGANLAEMTSVLGLPVPPGFTITTEACRAALERGWPDGLEEQVAEQLRALEAMMGRRLGDPEDPLLVSVRSGAAVSMPGMMDTILNLGLNDESVRGLAEATGDARFAWDSYRRLVQMYGEVVLGVEGRAFDVLLREARDRRGVDTDAQIPAEDLEELVGRFGDLIGEQAADAFPQDPIAQLHGAIDAVFGSWRSPRARSYRRRERIPDDLGTAVNVQAMVFGNRDERSGTGVGFTRNPATGEAEPYGDFLLNAQGEDVVAGIRATEPLAKLGEHLPEVHSELLEAFDRLEGHYRDMLDIEFTIEQGKLWILQTRVGKRTGAAALRIAVEMVEDARIRLSREEAVVRVQPDHLDQVLHPGFEEGEVSQVLTTGLPASPGAAVGRVYLDPDRALDAHLRGEQVLLVREETSPEDVHGMEVAEGIVTARGGLASHAAVVARGWGKPAVCGAEALDVGDDWFRVGDTVVAEGEVVSIDGGTGEVVLGEVELHEQMTPPELEVLLGWADEIRGDRVGVRANADDGPDARRAREFGAAGIGLARTEHMFLGERLPLVRRLILAEGGDEERAALEALAEVQRHDFEELLEVMDGLPVTIRLLDPPLHEFLPRVEEIVAGELRGDLDEHGRRLHDAARAWQEQNPMLGTRGVRLAFVKRGLYEMQVRAISEAILARRDAGGDPVVEIMVPLVVTPLELRWMRGRIEEQLDQTLGEVRDEVVVRVGTMIETPRAALVAREIAEVADFFSFGTNDLTQMTFGFSRDDVEGRIMGAYLDEGLLARNPFETLDTEAVGELVRIGAERGRATDPDLKLGVCGEHGGDAESIAFLVEVGVDYVSCSPFRVPIARLALAHACLEAGDLDGR